MVESKADLENLARFAAGTGVFLDNDDVEDSAMIIEDCSSSVNTEPYEFHGLSHN